MEVECGCYGKCSFDWIGLLLTGTDVYKSCGEVTFTTSFVITTIFNPDEDNSQSFSCLNTTLGVSRNCQTSTFLVFSL